MSLVSSNDQFDSKANKILADQWCSVFAALFVLSVCGLVLGLKWLAPDDRGGGQKRDVIIIRCIVGHLTAWEVNSSVVNCQGGDVKGGEWDGCETSVIADLHWQLASESGCDQQSIWVATYFQNEIESVDEQR